MDYTDEYNDFIENFTVRRSCENFNGCWTDLVIEQTANREAKVPGGIVQRGYTQRRKFKSPHSRKNIVFANK